MPTILPLAPSATLEPSSLLAPEGETTYIDAPTGTIGGTLVVGTGGIVKVGGTSVNQQPERPRRYPQQQPPRILHIEYHAGNDQPTGRIQLTGTVAENQTRTRFSAPHIPSHEPTIQDVLAAQRRARRQVTRIREKAGQS